MAKRARTWRNKAELEGFLGLSNPWDVFEKRAFDLLSVEVRPDGGGFPVRLEWNGVSGSFEGCALDGQKLWVALDEMECMYIDPLGRQFQGFRSKRRI